MTRFLICLMALTVSLPALAAEKRSLDTPLARLDRKTTEMMKDLDKTGTREFEIIRGTHGTLRAVEDINKSLGTAAGSCAAANPEMKEAMEGRYQGWKNAVLPVMRRGQNRLEKMILTQSFARPSQVRGYLKTVDDALADRSKSFQPVPVSEKKACENLLKNMDDSQARMIDLMMKTIGLDKEPEERAADQPAQG